MTIKGFCKDCEYRDCEDGYCKMFNEDGFEETDYCSRFVKRYKDTIGGRIAKCREMKNETQEAFAKAIGAKRQAIAQWENDLCGMTIPKIVLIAEHFNVTCDYLLRGKE